MVNTPPSPRHRLKYVRRWLGLLVVGLLLGWVLATAARPWLPGVRLRDARIVHDAVMRRAIRHYDGVAATRRYRPFVVALPTRRCVLFWPYVPGVAGEEAYCYEDAAGAAAAPRVVAP